MQKIFLLYFILFLTGCNSHNSERTTGNLTTLVNNGKDTLPTPFPKIIGYVNDFASILSNQNKISLEKKIENYDKKTTRQITIVTIDSDTITQENFDKYGLDLVNYWGVGTKEKNNGLAILIHPKLGRIKIYTGIGTEKILTDQICQKVIETIVIPQFQEGNYYGGLNQATDELIRLWK